MDSSNAVENRGGLGGACRTAAPTHSMHNEGSEPSLALARPCPRSWMEQLLVNGSRRINRLARDMWEKYFEETLS